MRRSAAVATSVAAFIFLTIFQTSCSSQLLDLAGYNVTFFDDFNTFDWYNATAKTGGCTPLAI